ARVLLVPGHPPFTERSCHPACPLVCEYFAWPTPPEASAPRGQEPCTTSTVGCPGCGLTAASGRGAGQETGSAGVWWREVASEPALVTPGGGDPACRSAPQLQR